MASLELEVSEKKQIEIRDKLWLSPKEASLFLGTSIKAVRGMMKVGLLPFLQIGSHFKIYTSELEELKHKMTYMKFDLNTLELIPISPSDVEVY